jgi:uncharacterized membrane protein YcaP (DUF421 family)
MFEIDWQQIFGFEKPFLELFIRGTVMYWFLFLIFRFVLRRDVGALGIADVLLIVIIADAAQNAMSDDYKSLPEGMVVVGTLVLWNVVIDWLHYHVPAFARFAEPRELLLIREGRVLERNLRRELITRDELMSKLREQGVEKPEEVRWAYMESDGQISVRRYADDGRRVRREGAAGA